MTGDCHVRFCESRGLQCPRPLAYGKNHAAKRSHKRARSGKATRFRSASAGGKGR
jgi:hypothetical protein